MSIANGPGPRADGEAIPGAPSYYSTVCCLWSTSVVRSPLPIVYCPLSVVRSSSKLSTVLCLSLALY